MSSDEAAVVACVTEYLQERLGALPDDLSRDRPFASFGLDSMDGIVMAGLLEERLGVPIDPALFLRNETLAMVLAELRSQGLLAAT